MKHKNKRKLNGILLLDKALNFTSNSSLQRVKHLYQARKAGHTGSLDPLATGMLPLCFGEATKYSEFLLNADKTYIVGAKLGEKTTTGDAEGDVISRRDLPPGLDDSVVEACIAKFRGDISQVPSMYSALKYKGRPLYEYARKGITVERQPRQVNIKQFTVLKFEGDYLCCKVACSKGTYIRNLIEDLGEEIGCGAHVIELRRLSVAGFDSRDMVSFSSLHEEFSRAGLSAIDKYVLPISTAVRHFSDVILDARSVADLRQGKMARMITDSQCSEGKVALYSTAKDFIGVGEVLSSGQIKAVKLLAF